MTGLVAPEGGRSSRTAVEAAAAETKRRRFCLVGLPELRPPPTASRCVPPLQEPNPSTNLKLPPPERRTPSFFSGSGQFRRHHCRASSSEPPLDSSLREHPLDSLYLPLLLTPSFFPTGRRHRRLTPRRPGSPSPSRSGLSPTPPIGLVSSPHPAGAHALAILAPTPSERRRALSPPRRPRVAKMGPWRGGEPEGGGGSTGGGWWRAGGSTRRPAVEGKGRGGARMG